MLKLFIESVGDNVFSQDLKKAGNYAREFSDNEKVGKVTAYEYKKFEKGLNSRVKYMTGKEYINRCANDIFGLSYEKTVYPVEWEAVHKYAEAMKQGAVFPMPYLDYVHKQQEGRHRALAFAEAFGEDEYMPVLVITKASPSIKEIEQYCKKKWGDHWDSFFPYMAEGFGFNQGEIYEYLGLPEPVDPDFEIDDSELEISADELGLE